MATETQKPNPTLADDPKKTLTTAPSEAEPQLSTAAEQQSSESPPVSDDAGADAAKSDADDPNSKGMNGGGPAVLPHGAALPADVQKKVKRAERFGVPVKLSEEEKRNSRAERFGTGSGANASKGFGTGSGADASKGAEEQKRKARAERFGLAAQSAGDEDGKKKARLDRFAPVTKVDPLEEEKRKARALRFTQPAVKSNGNGKGSVESLSNTAIAGKAGEEV